MALAAEVDRAGDVETPARPLRPRDDDGDLAGRDDLRPAVLLHRARQGHLPRVPQPGRPARPQAAGGDVRRDVHPRQPRAPAAAGAPGRGPPRLPRAEPGLRAAPGVRPATGPRHRCRAPAAAARRERRAAGAEEGLRRAAPRRSRCSATGASTSSWCSSARPGTRPRRPRAGRRARARRRRRAYAGRAVSPSCCGCTSEATVLALACRVADDGDRDGIPNVLVEAMAAGLPVVTTAVSGIPELVRDGENGLLVPSERPRRPGRCDRPGGARPRAAGAPSPGRVP